MLDNARPVFCDDPSGLERWCGRHRNRVGINKLQFGHVRVLAIDVVGRRGWDRRTRIEQDRVGFLAVFGRGGGNGRSHRGFVARSGNRRAMAVANNVGDPGLDAVTVFGLDIITDEVHGLGFGLAAEKRCNT